MTTMHATHDRGTPAGTIHEAAASPAPTTGPGGDAALIALFATAEVCEQAFLWLPPHGLGQGVAGFGVRDELVPAPNADRFAIDTSSLAPGERAFGGFSFAASEPTGSWKGFGRASLVVPEVTVCADGRIDGDGTLAAELRAKAAECAQPTGSDAPPRRLAAGYQLTSVPAPDVWLDLVARTVADRSVDKLVLARTLAIESDQAFDLTAALGRLRATFGSCWTFAIRRGDTTFLGASPELLLDARANHVRSLPLAGTAPRGSTDIEDAAAAEALLADAKNRHEHALLADAVADALRPFCTDLTRDDVPRRLDVGAMLHLATQIDGSLRDDAPGPLALLGALHPTPAVGAVPRAAADRLAELEAFDRGWYGGPIGWTDGTDATFVLGLRCGIVRGASATLYAGAGIVEGSDPGAELAETRMKFRPMLDALVTP